MLIMLIVGETVSDCIGIVDATESGCRPIRMHAWGTQGCVRWHMYVCACIGIVDAALPLEGDGTPLIRQTQNERTGDHDEPSTSSRGLLQTCL
jgi:hypothetical protein